MQEKFKKRTNKAVDPIALETWINDMLQESEFFEIRGTIKRTKKAQGAAAGIASGLCFEYGIDRLTLNNSGISSESTDKLYRSFFVTTVGFLNTIKELLKEQADQNKLTNGVHYQLKDVSPQDAIKHEKDQGGVQDNQKCHKTKNSLLSAIWRVYGILMEYAHSTEHKLNMTSLQEENQKRLND